LIPTESVQRSTEGAGNIVMVVGSDGAAAKRAVTVGIQTDESAQVLSGLKPGDMVITTGGYGLDEGTKVKVGPAEEKGSSGKSDDATGGKE
jgi:HlyD family secretion protein